jgi:hypothetical protein
MRLSTGEIKRGIAWAMAAPLMSVKTFLKYSDRLKYLSINEKLRIKS